jgi:hypothetical protein
MKTCLRTPGGRKLDRPSNMERGDPSNLERWYSPDQAVEILCSTTEREDFEEETKLDFKADVLTPAEFQEFVVWLIVNVGLKGV